MKRLRAQSQMIKELLEACNSKLNTAPERSEILRIRGILYNLSEKYDQAIADLDLVIDTLPHEETTYYLRGHCHYKNENFDLAKQDFIRALKIKDNIKMKDWSEEEILQVKISDEEELKNIEKVLEYEMNRALVNFIPQLY